MDTYFQQQNPKNQPHPTCYKRHGKYKDKRIQEKSKTMGLVTDYIEASFNQLDGFPTARVPYHTLEICKWTAIVP